MLTLNDFSISANSLGGEYLLVGIVPSYQYSNGQRTDTLDGYRYDIVLPKLRYERLGVKIPGKQLVEMMEGETIPVRIDGLEIRPYVSNGKIAFSAKATGISRLKT